jgi:cholesterol transport system auxiliary component
MALHFLKNTTKIIAACAMFYWAKALFNRVNVSFTLVAGLAVVLLATAGCATPQAPVAKAVYDFGPALAQPSVPASTASTASLPPALALAEVDANAALESTAVVYRLAYADARQLRPYALARWSMPPAQLVRLRLRDALAANGPVLSGTDSAAIWVLKVELDEFSQVFDAPASSSGVVRLRATLLRANQWVGQRSIWARAPATSADAAGGAKALAAATDDAAKQLAEWVALQLR